MRRYPAIESVLVHTGQHYDEDMSRVYFDDLALARPDVDLEAGLGYLDLLHLMTHANLVLTDSGGFQEESTVLGVPCLTLRSNTERPVTITEGTNTVVATNPDRILTEAKRIFHDGGKVGRIPRLWDVNAAQRVLAVIAQRFALPPPGVH